MIHLCAAQIFDTIPPIIRPLTCGLLPNSHPTGLNHPTFRSNHGIVCFCLVSTTAIQNPSSTIISPSTISLVLSRDPALLFPLYHLLPLLHRPLRYCRPPHTEPVGSQRPTLILPLSKYVHTVTQLPLRYGAENLIHSRHSAMLAVILNISVVFTFTHTAIGLYLQQRNKLRPQELIDADLDGDEAEEILNSEDTTGPQCSHCQTRKTSVWRRSKTGQKLCNACGVYSRLRGKDRPLSLKRNKIKPRTKHSK